MAMSGENTAAGAEAGAASDGARHLGRRERRRAATTREVAHAMQCNTPGCARSSRTRKRFHNHCCSLCTVGSHTARCDEHWRRFQRDGARRRLSICAVSTCGRLAGLTQAHCCTLCQWSGGARHAAGCDERQRHARASAASDHSQVRSTAAGDVRATTMALSSGPAAADPSTQMRFSVQGAGTSLRYDDMGTILVESSSSEFEEGGAGEENDNNGALYADMEVDTTAESGELESGGGQTFYAMCSYSAALATGPDFNLDALD